MITVKQEISAEEDWQVIQFLFADRDGTLIVDKHYLSDPEKVELIPHAAEALKLLQDKGVKVLVVTNQSGIGRGYFTEKDLFACQDRLAELLAEQGAALLDYAYCPHAPEENCSCRKPLAGMWKQLSEKYGISPQDCAMAGDKKEDVLFGISAGFGYSCLVLTGKGQKTAEEYGLPCDSGIREFSAEILGVQTKLTRCFVASDLAVFAEFLLTK